MTPLYDVPHLLKGIRNNLLTKNLVWRDEKDTHVAKWQHIITAYKIDNTYTDIRFLTKLSRKHLYEREIKKMKVSYAAQVLSHSMALAISSMARNSKYQSTITIK